MLGVYGTAVLLLTSCWPVDLFTCFTSLEVVNETLWRTACWSGMYETAVTALSGLAGGDDAHEGGELNAWSPDRVAEEPTALSLPCLPPENGNIETQKLYLTINISIYYFITRYNMYCIMQCLCNQRICRYVDFRGLFTVRKLI